MSIASFFRLAGRIMRLAVALFPVAATLLAQNPSANDGFDPNVDGNVYAVAVQPDGKVLLAGQFAILNPGIGGGIGRNNIARVNPDGSLDFSFDPNVNGPIRAMILQPDGKILVGGDFSAVQPNGSSTAVTRHMVARFNTDGSLDTGFDPNVAGSLTPTVQALALQPNGQVIIGGMFATVGGAAHKNLARVSAAGVVDATYTPAPNNIVLALAPHIDNKVVVGGGFTSFDADKGNPATVRNRAARLNPDGTVDSQFDCVANNAVTAIAIQRDGKVLLGGSFTQMSPIGSTAPVNLNHIARINTDGTQDTTWAGNAASTVNVIGIQQDGGVLVGGVFSSVWAAGAPTVSRAYVARFFPDGTVDQSFAPGANQAVNAFGFQSDGKIIFGGYFTRMQPNGLASSAAVRNHVARVNANGSLDNTFQPENNGGRPLVSIVSKDGKQIYIGGSFTSIGGITRYYLARINAADGSLDTSYYPAINGRVFAGALQSDGKLLIGGSFTTVAGTARNNLARLNTDGSLDTGFDPDPSGNVGSIVVQSDGKILLGGSFSTFTPNSSGTTTLTNFLARVNTDGTLDTTFNPNPNSTVNTIVPQADGKLLIGGAFTSFTSTDGKHFYTRNSLARINADGSMDESFDPEPSTEVMAIAVQSDGKIIVGGQFLTFNPGNKPVTSTTNKDGTVTLSTIPRNRIARLNADGTVDTNFNPNLNDSVITLVLQSDGKIDVGGPFTTVQPPNATDWIQRKYFVRLNSDGTVDTSVNLDINEVTGSRVDSLALQADGKILIGGNFTSMQPIGSTTRVPVLHYARLNTNGTIDTAFTVGSGGAAGSQIKTLALQTDGRLLAAGSFTDVSGATSTSIARFNAEGTADTAFSASLTADGPVNAVVVRPDGSPIPTQGNGLAWINPDGSLLKTFNPSKDSRISGRVSAFAIQSDGSILVGGAFTVANGFTSGNLIRYRPDGTLDTNFNPGPNGTVTSIIVQTDGKIVIGGSFSIVSGKTRYNMARLNTDGSADSGYDPYPSGIVNSLVLQSDGKIIAGGAFTTFQPNGATSTTARANIARINTDGTLDSGYNPTANASVDAMVMQADGNLVIGGTFTTLQPGATGTQTTRDHIARLKPDGSIDTNYDPNASGNVTSLALFVDGKIIVGGQFNSFTPTVGTTAMGTTTRNFIARLNTDGSLDSNFDPEANASVDAIAVMPDDSIVLGGQFSAFAPNAATSITTRNHLARFNFAGQLDTSFDPSADGAISALLPRADGTLLVGGVLTSLQPTGPIVIGGAFVSIAGTIVPNMALLSADGTLNTSFGPYPNNPVTSLLALPDGRMLAGGGFQTLGGVNRADVARFNSDGTVDPTFNASLGGGIVNVMALQADGKILLGGTFTSASNQARARLSRVNADGSLDTTFTASIAGAVLKLAVQADGKILVGAGSTPSGGTVATIIRLNTNGTVDSTFNLRNNGTVNDIEVLADGHILVGGTFTSIGGASLANIARVNADGSADTTYNPAVNGAVTALAAQPDGRVAIAGAFDHVGLTVRPGLARLAATAPATQTFGVSQSSITWTRGQAAPELSGATFEYSTDDHFWNVLGVATRVPGTPSWQMGGLALPSTGLFYIRARGIVPAGSGTSSGVIETIREINLNGANTTITFSDNGAVSLNGNRGIDQMFAPLDLIAVSTVTSSVNQGGNGSGSNVQISTNAAGISSHARLVNISARARVSADSPLITGFAIRGTASRAVLVRGIGPGLTAFGVGGALSTPHLQLLDANGKVVLDNSGWTTAGSDLAPVFTRTGAFGLAAGSADTAALVTLAPGNYTVQVTGANGATGVALAEIYDAGDAASAGSQLINISTRANVTPGDGAFVSGFVIQGDANANYLIRGIGPSLSSFGVANVVTDPAITVYNVSGQPVMANDNWSSTASDGSASANTLVMTALAQSAGAFPLVVGSKDASVAISLTPGTYTVQLTGAAGSATAAMIEIYELPQ